MSDRPAAATHLRRHDDVVPGGAGNPERPGGARGSSVPWQNLVDLRVVEVFTTRGMKFEPTLDVYNLFNNNAVTNAVVTIGTSLGRPSAIVMGRLFRVGGRISF